MKKSLMSLMFISTLLLSCCIATNAMVFNLNLTEMIINADNIGYYSVIQTDEFNKFDLKLQYNIKGDSCSSLFVGKENLDRKKLASNKETVLLFIKRNIETGNNVLIGMFGNEEMLSGYSICNQTNMAEMEDAIKKISNLHKLVLSQRIDSIYELIKSEKPLVRYAALNYSVSSPFRKLIPNDQSVNVSSNICASALGLIDDKVPQIRSEVLRLLLNAPSYLKLSIAPKYLKDSDISCRQNARKAIYSAIYNKKVVNSILNDFQPSPTNQKKLDDYNMEAIQYECKKVLDSRPDIKEKDIKYLDKLVAEGKITKQSADIFKSYMK